MDDLADLLTDAVADIEPSDRLSEIRAAVSPRPRRLGWYAAGGASLAVAAAVTAIALATSPGTIKANDSGPIANSPSATDTPAPNAHSVPVYFLGATPAGPRLFREFQIATGNAGLSDGTDAIMAGPDDPDYASLWPDDAFAAVDFRYDDGTTPTQIDVTIADADLRDRPSSMTEAEAELAIQQVVYTLQAVAQNRLPVQFRFGDNPIDQVFGVPTSEPLAEGSQLDVLALVSISDPAEGQVVTRAFTARGAASSFEGNVPWQLLDSSGAVVRDGFATAGMGETLIPWETEPIDVSDLPPGSYTFRASTDDPSAGEGPGAFTDTRTVVVQ